MRRMYAEYSYLVPVRTLLPGIVVVVVVVVVVVLTLTQLHNTMPSVVAGQAPITLEWKKYVK